MKRKSKILRPKYLKSILIFFGSSFFVFTGFLMLEDDPLMGWMSICFFSLGVIISLLQLIPSASYLKLTEEGFEVRNLYRSEFIKWSDVKVFRVGSVGMNQMVMYDYTGSHTKYKSGKKLSKFLSGSESALPITYGMSAKKLADLMNEWKSKKELS